MGFAWQASLLLFPLRRQRSVHLNKVLRLLSANVNDPERERGVPQGLDLYPHSSPVRMQTAPMLQFLLQSSDLDWEDSPFGRGWVALQLELAVAAPGRRLVLAVPQQRCGSGQGWRHPG